MHMITFPSKIHIRILDNFVLVLNWESFWREDSHMLRKNSPQSYRRSIFLLKKKKSFECLVKPTVCGWCRSSKAVGLGRPLPSNSRSSEGAPSFPSVRDHPSVAEAWPQPSALGHTCFCPAHFQRLLHHHLLSITFLRYPWFIFDYRPCQFLMRHLENFKFIIFEK